MLHYLNAITFPNVYLCLIIDALDNFLFTTPCLSFHNFTFVPDSAPISQTTLSFPVAGSFLSFHLLDLSLPLVQTCNYSLTLDQPFPNISTTSNGRCTPSFISRPFYTLLGIQIAARHSFFFLTSFSHRLMKGSEDLCIYVKLISNINKML